jgi:hypothetical protein
VKVEAEQFVFPFLVIRQAEFLFIPSASIFDGWGPLEWFAWFRVVARAFSVDALPRIASKIAALEIRLGLLRLCHESAYRSGLCLEGVVVFRESCGGHHAMELRGAATCLS